MKGNIEKIQFFSLNFLEAQQCPSMFQEYNKGERRYFSGDFISDNEKEMMMMVGIVSDDQDY